MQIERLLRHQDVVARRLNVPQGHHGVIFMNYVMAMNRVLAQPIAEAEENLHSLVGVHLYYVLTSLVRGYGQRVGRGQRHAVTAQNLVLDRKSTRLNSSH